MTQLTGTGPVVAAQGLYEESLTALHNLGELVHSNDGRAFRYCKAGDTALAAGKLQQSSAQDTGDHNLAIAAAAAGAVQIVTTSTVTVTANQYAEGFVLIADDAGEGYMYRISSHAAATAAVVTLNLSDKIVVALTTATTIDLVKNPYDSVIINPTTVSSSVAGVAVKALTAAYFGWLQVAGPCSVLANGALTVGTDVVASDAVAGAVEITADATPEILSVVGTAMIAVTDTEYGLVNLKLL
jgi:hypothetical protein